MEQHRLRVFESSVLKRMFGPWREKGQEDGENCIMRIFTVCTLYEILLGWSNQGRWDGQYRYNELGGHDKCVQNFSQKAWKKETSWET